MAQSVKDAVKFVEQGRILSVRADLVSHIDPSLQCRLCINLHANMQLRHSRESDTGC